jgi:ABC-type phosphate transport system permease subunit
MTKFVKEITSRIMYSLTFFENRSVYEIMWKNVVERGRPQKYGACPLLARYLRLRIHTPRICNPYSFFIATTVARTYLDVPIYIHCLSC